MILIIAITVKDTLGQKFRKKLTDEEDRKNKTAPLRRYEHALLLASPDFEARPGLQDISAQVLVLDHRGDHLADVLVGDEEDLLGAGNGDAFFVGQGR